MRTRFLFLCPGLTGKLARPSIAEPLISTDSKAYNGDLRGRTLNRRAASRVLDKEALDEYNRVPGTEGTAPAGGNHAAGSAAE